MNPFCRSWPWSLPDIWRSSGSASMYFGITPLTIELQCSM